MKKETIKERIKRELKECNRFDFGFGCACAIWIIVDGRLW